MAIESPTPKSPEVAGKEFATRINDAVQRNDSKLYTDTMAGINDWTTKNAPSLHGKFEESLIGSVDLKTAALFETRENFSKIDTNNDKRVKPEELKAYASKPETNALQKAMIDKEILPQYEDIANYSKDRYFSSILRDSHIRSIDLDKGLEQAAAKRPEQKLTEEQVAEKTKAPEFAAESLNYAKSNFDAIDKNKNSKLDKKELEDFANDPSRSPLQKAFIKSGILPQFDNIANANRDNIWSGLGVADTEIRRGDLDKRMQKEYAKPETQTALAESKKTEVHFNEQLKELATVRRGEGPYHSAERILAAAGGQHGIDEVRALTKALKTMYQEKHGDLKDLPVKHNFVTSENIEKLIENVHNDKAKAALRKLAAA